MIKENKFSEIIGKKEMANHTARKTNKNDKFEAIDNDQVIGFRGL
jgi:hypothetical protein